MDNCEGIRGYKVIFLLIIGLIFLLFVFSQCLYTSADKKIVFMNNDEPDFEKKAQKFSVVEECPKCGHISLSFKENRLYCSNCGYDEKIPALGN